MPSIERMNEPTLSRRALLTVSAAIGGGLLLGFPLNAVAARGGVFAPNAFVRIAQDGVVTVIVPYVEMGQGTFTAIPMLVAEELEVPLAQVRVEAAPPDEARYAHPIFKGQITGGSASIRGAWEPMRRAGATARVMLVRAAAQRWGVAVGSCRAESGEVRHLPSGRKLAYGALVDAAAKLPLPERAPLKDPKQFRLVGTAAKRLDTPEKVKGQTEYGIDARPPGVKYAVVMLSPELGGSLGDVDDSAALAVRGVLQIVKLNDAVAVVAEHTGAARKGLAALKTTWRAGPNANLSTPDLVRAADAALEQPGVVAKNQGEVERAEASAATVFEATYRMPMLAHAALEPMNCTVHVRPGECEIWVGTQVAGRAQQTAADVTGLPLEKVVLHNLQIGGGFGRRLDVDGVTLAVRIARNVDGPVKVTWSREEDIRHDNFRYINHSRVRIGLDRDGKPLSWSHRVVGPAVMARWLPMFFQNGVDLDIVGGSESPYDIPNVRVDFVRHEAPPGFLSGNWRGVGGMRNAVPVECAIDEVAQASGADPVAYRRALLSKAPRLRAVLDLAAARAGWGSPLPPRSGRGVALLHDFGSYFALIAELAVGDDGRVRVSRFVCALDCGEVINPDTVKAQIEGGVIFGLSAALYGSITVKNGRVVESNFDSQPIVRMNETPRIDVHLIQSHESPGGVGEVGTCPVAPAMLNAIFAATGKRLRDTPLALTELRKG